MPWAKIDDGFFRHPKVIAAGLEARALFMAALCYASSQLTDGLVIPAALPALAADAGIPDPEAAAARLVQVGLWERQGDAFLIHDYLDYNPSGESVKQRRAATQERVREWRQARKSAGNAVTNAFVTPPPARDRAPVNPVPVPRTSDTHVSVAPADAALPAPPPQTAPPGTPPRPSPRPGWVERHPFFVPLAAHFGRPGGAEWSLWGKEIVTLSEKTNDVPPEATAKEIPRRVRQWPKVMGVGTDGTPLVLTLPALVKHWHLLAPGGTNGRHPTDSGSPAYQPDPDLKALVQRSLGRGPRAPNDLPGV